MDRVAAARGKCAQSPKRVSEKIGASQPSMRVDNLLLIVFAKFNQRQLTS